ncbi:MAG: EthD family reductase [Chloroflexi bacterium]|nr:EthD family reductase [Chloroflexota bacterium]
MYKLVILIEPQPDWQEFERVWPQFLKRAEKMPGLIRESTSPVDQLLHGHYHVAMIHELYFESMQSAQDAMASPAGEEAGKTLQTITAGKVTLLFADHLEDELKNIQAHQSQDDSSETGEDA